MPSMCWKRSGEMSPEPAAKRDVLTKRVRRLLGLEGYASAQTEVSLKVLPYLSSLGAVALIGGAIRDVARAGRRGFSSDFDFVIYDSDRQAFIAEMKARDAKPNKFGGYFLSLFERTKVDVWHIEDTWARTAGLASVTGPADLLNCTFFDWDSVVYELGPAKLIAPTDYFQRLALNVMDIRLEENPNPTGSLVRALRRAYLWHVKFGPRLTAFAKRHLTELRWDDLVALDARAFSFPVLRCIDPAVLMERLDRYSPTPVGDATQPVPDAQLHLAFDTAFLERVGT